MQQFKMSSPAILLLFLVLLVPPLTCSSDLTICVDEVNGHDDSNCLQPHEQPCGYPCQSLEYVQHKANNFTNHSVVIEICNSRINLTAALVFEDFVGLSIRGSRSMRQTTINCNTSFSGLSFFNITGLSLSFLRLTNCGAKGNSTSFDPPTAKCLIVTSAVYILNCTDVTIQDITLNRSNGTGISMYDTNGKVSIENTKVEESFVRGTSDEVFGGGGMHIEFTYCTPGTININCTHSKGRNQNATYTIRNCTFSKNFINVSKINESQYYNNPTSWLIGQPIGSGGGAYIIFASNASDITITLNECTFQGNYAPRFGGGLKVVFLDSVKNNRVSLIETEFLNNNVSSTTMAGGLQISFKFFKLALGYLEGAVPENNAVYLRSCDFKNNRAHSGGGVNVFSAEIPLQDTHSAVHFTNCTWTGNTALHGAAVHIVPGMWPSFNDGHYPLVMFSNTNISSNMVLPKLVTNRTVDIQTNGAGAFFSTQLNIHFCGRTQFMDNNGTALYLINSIAKFSNSSQIVFDGNNGTNGGGVALIGRSFLYVNHSCNFIFVNNTASRLGGGIYFQTTDTSTSQPCFIYRGYQVSRSNSSFHFNGNHAGAGRGHHIYVSSFNSCDIYCEEKTQKYPYGCIGIFTFNNPTKENSTASYPTYFTLNHTSPFSIFPGLSTQLPLIVRDLENNVSNMAYEAVLKNKSSRIYIESAFEYVSNNTINIRGQPPENTLLYLNPLASDISLLMEIKLTDCPPGYVLEKGKCECGSMFFFGILKCDPEAYLQYGIWMGKCNHKSMNICTSSCPLGYCAYKNQNAYQHLPMNVSLLEQAICSPGRTGTNCGSCKPNHSVYYNSWTFECGREDKCHLGVLFYIVSTLIPLTVLFLGIIVFDTNIVNGWNGFLFYTQIVAILPIHANGIIHFPKPVFETLDSILFVYNFFNLDFFDFHPFSFCLWKGATVMDILMVQLGSMCFALSLVFITVFLLNQHKFAKYCPCLLRRQYTVFNGLSAFFILCYARCAWICFRILVPACLYNLNNNESECKRRVAFYSGDLEYFKGAHIKYATVAVIPLIFIVILPAFLLLFYPLFFKFLGLCNLGESRAAIFLWKMMPMQLLDSFQNPFKNNYRCFAGLYFVYRAILLTQVVFTRNLTQFYASVELGFIIMIVLHATFQPYKQRVHNIVDLLLFFNLALINGITIYNFHLSVESKSNTVVAKDEDGVYAWMVILNILLCIPLVSATFIVIRKILIMLKKTLKRNTYQSIKPMYAMN